MIRNIYIIMCRSLLLVLLLLCGSMSSVWGQSATLADGDGYYYIKNYNTNYFLKPAAAGPNSNTNPYYQEDTNMPFLSTNTTGEAPGSLWILKRNGDYYQIIHAEDGKYVTTNGSVISGQEHRKRMHLESRSAANDDNDFVLATNGDYYNISHKTMVQGSHKYWNPSGGNWDYDDGGTNGYSGIVGLYSGANDNGSKWKFVFVSKCVTPEIRVSIDGVVTITSVTHGVTIYYTTNGDTPTTSSTEYSSGFTLSGTTVKAIAVKTGFTNSDVAEATFSQTATPTFDQTNCDNTIAINCADAGATIIYTTDGSTPSSSNGTPYVWPFTPATGATVKAVAYVEGEKFLSSIATLSYSPAFTEVPTITVMGNTLTITGSGTFYYTTDGTTPTVGNSGQEYTVPVDLDISGSVTIKAVAKSGGLGASCVAESRVLVAMSVSNLDQLRGIKDHPDYSYKLSADIDASGFNEDITFTGLFEGDFHTITGLTRPLFTSVNGGTVKDVMLKGVNISSSLESVGAIAGVAEGYSCIYNCGILPNDATFPEGTHPSVSTTGSYAGSIVGSLKDDSRVVNCFSYADVSSAGTAAGIVGNNTYASDASVTGGKYTKLRTMVVNCIYYGNISATTIYPVYGGQKISNKGANAINNYNFYSVGCIFTPALTGYYCSWPAQLEYLTRYEFHRNLLNSNRELCGWWVGAPSAPSTMSVADVQAVPKDASLIAKWVLDPALAPYPILKPFGKYASPVNIDADADWRTTANEWEGKKLGSLDVTVSGGAHHSGSESLTLPITDMDTLRADYCYRKVQLPYYNTVFGNPNGVTWAQKYGHNYGDYVVIGWKVSASGGTVGKLVEDWQNGYNFADRNCTAKDANRVFAQGGYYYVPEGVTSITITAQWAKAVYFDNTDHSYDRVFMSNSKPGTHFAPAGTRPTTLGNGKTVLTSNLRDLAKTASYVGDNVYEYAVVLVGNHQYRHSNENIGETNSTQGFTVLSSDFDFDEEPDHCLIWQLGQKTDRQAFCPIRFDFLPVEEIGLAMKEDGSTQYYSLGCYRPLGHFEVTETSLIHFGQFEYSNKNRTIDAPIILNAGIFDQYTKGNQTLSFSVADDKINYIIIGGNVRMPSFTPGAHVNSNASFPTRHCAVNVIGGCIDNLYLTGNYNEGIVPNKDNPHCYIDGGRIKHVAAAGKEGIDGDVYFKVNHAKIWEFYGGSTMDLSTGTNFKTVKGNIDVTINNSIVNKYCGGPKFGDMIYDEVTPANSKTITTNANNTTFGVYYGGGNGGTSYVQYDKTDNTSAVIGFNWNTSGKLNGYTPGNYRNRATGYMADYDTEIINISTGTESGQAVFRTYFFAAQFSATNTGPITNNLTNCTVLTNFYGGGNLGGVKGSVTSTLTDTQVHGSAFGAGFSASIPEVIIQNKDRTPASIDVNTGIVTPQSSGTSTTYFWTNDFGSTGSPITTASEATGGKNCFFTEVSLTDLGTVSGNVSLTITGDSKIGLSGTDHNVFGGGDQSAVSGNTTVTLEGNTQVLGSVFGGGNRGVVEGSTTVNIQE